MDKSAVEKFAVNARMKLRQSVEQRLTALGIAKDGTFDPVQAIGDVAIISLRNGMETKLTKDESSHRNQLIEEIRKTGFDNIVESVAYTWFNRLIAIRYMEVNDFLPTHVRVLSSSIPEKKEPDLIAQCLSVDVGLQENEKKRVFELKSNEESDKLFVMLFKIQCRDLNRVLPELFTLTKRYEDLLLNISYTDPDGVVRDLVDKIPEDDFKDAVQIIGWMYQYYNTELKADTFAKLKKNTKITKERIPSATQLFTPDWIVRYMVENSVGRIWLEGHDDQDLKNKWKYYLDEAEQDPAVEERLKDVRKDRRKISPASIKVIDPCMGSGHILVYAFDVLMQIYLSYGYSREESAVSIVENNLYGLDIDDRAYQLAYFAVMMKARQYDSKLFEKNIGNNIHSIVETSNITDNDLSGYGNTMPPLDRHSAVNEIKYVLELFRNGKMFGSLIDVRECDWQQIKRFLADRRIDIRVNPTIHGKIQEAVEVAKVLSQKYYVVVTNPPYMGSSGMDPVLTEYVKSTHPDAKADLFACFIEKVRGIANVNGFYSMITMHAFMFLSSFEKLRKKMSSQTLINMAHLGPHAFDEIGGEVVQTTSFVMMNADIKGHFGTYIRLVGGAGEADKERMFFEKERTFTVKQEEFSKIPGAPIAYWASREILSAFDNSKTSKYADTKKGLSTGDVEKFTRLWFEVSIKNIEFNCESNEESIESGYKWFPYMKGGDFRRWYGNKEYIVNWENDGFEVRTNLDEKGKQRSRPQNVQYYFKNGITYTAISSSKFAVRDISKSVFGGGGDMICPHTDNDNQWLLGFFNSSVAFEFLKIISPTINFEVGHLLSLPLKRPKSSIDGLVNQCIALTKDDWDEKEISWDYEKNPLIGTSMRLNDSCQKYLFKKQEMFNQLKTVEISINEILIDTYNLKNDVSASIDDRDVSIIIPDLKNITIDLLSYAVGCMFGRYSLDCDGLVFAGGKWNPDVYKKFKADSDNIIPINDDEYFGDDVVTRIVEFIEIAFGKEYLDENIKFIADNLGVKGPGTSKDKIRKYFLNDFYKDHLKMYQKRPIYWLFDSGKENGFKALIYMHRYDKNLIGRMRQNYLLPMQRRYTDQIEREKDPVKRSALQKKLTEVERYDLAVELYSSNPVSIDLDDGVKVNYAKFQNIENSKMSKDKIDLLYKI